GEAELKRVKHLLLASAVFTREGTMGLARSIGEAVTVEGDLEAARKYLPRLLAVPPRGVPRGAKEYLDPKPSAPARAVPPIRPKGGTGAPLPSPARARSPGRDDKAEKGAGGFDLKKTKRHVLDNGLVVLLFENRRLPIVEARLMLRDSSLLQP